MTNIETAVIAFTGFNAVRVVSYVPQIVKIWRDRHGSEAVSILTWTLFALSHFSTVAYAVVVVSDAYMATVFSANATCCVMIAVLTKRSRMLYARVVALPQPIQSPERQALLDLAKMAATSTDDDPAYRRAYADIAQHVRQKALSAL